MISYPDRGMYDADEFPAEEYERLVEDTKRYYKLFRIFTTILLCFGAAIALSFPRSAYLQISEVYKEGDTFGTGVMIVSVIVQAIVIGFLVFGLYKLYGLSGKVIKAVQRHDFTFSAGELTDKRHEVVRDKRNHTSTSNWTLFVNDIPCTDLSGDYPKARLGRKYYIIYVGKIRFAMPIRFQGVLENNTKELI